MVLAVPLPDRPAGGALLPGRSRQRPVAVLIVDADPIQRRNLASMIAERSGGRFVATGCANAAEAAAHAEPGSILIADLDTIGGAMRLPEVAGTCTTIATSANPSLAAAIAAMKSGATDFLPKPIGAKALIERLDAAVRGWRKVTSAPPAKVPAPTIEPTEADFAGFIGRSAPMLAVYEQIRRIAPSRAPAFITGESGTGKELAAEAIHTLSVRETDRPFVAINCSAIPKDLMESEIFGHVRGAFTGASEARAGAAELSNGGTLFLDELAEMDLALQAKLLRFVQTGSFRRVGGSETMRVDVRVVSATNRDPAVEVAGGRLRADLFYRLYVLPVHLPALCERREDIPPLAEAFLARFAAEEGRTFTGFEADAMAMLATHPLPGNVRQLANLIRRAVVLHDGRLITKAMLPAVAEGDPPPAVMAAREPTGAVPSYWEQERAIIERALAACGGSIARAAAALDISPSTIYRKRQSWAGQAARS